MWAASTRGSNPLLKKEGNAERTDSVTGSLLDRTFGDGRGSIGVRISAFPSPQNAGGAGNCDQRTASPKPASPKRQRSTGQEHRWTGRREERGPTGCEG